MKIATRPHWFSLAAAGIAAGSFVTAVVACGAALEGYSQSVHAVDLLGAGGVARAGWFDVFAFVVPGLLIAWIGLAVYLQGTRNSSMTARVGALIAMFSALAFVALGLFPLDLDRPDAPSSRAHAMAWSLWWLGIATGALLISVAPAASGRGPRRFAGLALAWMVPGFALFAPAQWGSAIPQRVAFAAWFAWWLLAASSVSRTEASAPGSSQRAGR